ncbi:MAG: ATP-binding domain-containing protein, partial [Caryophanon sp.]|nr:ATP-binding domain-containing protein [Caryophanon sp.]
NQIVRNVSADTLIIQGVAGSGKTAVALHRIAYFLYKFRDTLRPERIFILSPNKVFGDYISSVLPELGEQPIRSFTLDELTEQLLPASVSFTSFEVETKYILQHPTSELAKRTALKSNFSFIQTLQRFLAELDETMFTHEELTIGGVDFEPNYVQHRFLQYRSEPVDTRLKLIVEDIIDVLKAKHDGGKIPSRPDILQRLKKRMRYTTPFPIYKTFMETLGNPFVFKKKRFECNDVYPYLYVQHYMRGIKTYDMTQYFVLDEMQDYTPVQYAVLSKIFACPRTIIGDFSQALLPYDTISKAAFEHLFRDLHYAELTTTYRSSYEIAMYAKQFMRTGELYPIERHGKAPLELAYTSEAHMLAQLKEALHHTHKTTAIICKTDAQVTQLHEALADVPHVVLDGESKIFATGVVLTTIQYAKGLEFDTVIVPFVDAATYGSDFDRGLLYIATTRALHELTMLVSASESSPLLKLH